MVGMGFGWIGVGWVVLVLCGVDEIKYFILFQDIN